MEDDNQTSTTPSRGGREVVLLSGSLINGSGTDESKSTTKPALERITTSGNEVRDRLSTLPAEIRCMIWEQAFWTLYCPEDDLTRSQPCFDLFKPKFGQASLDIRFQPPPLLQVSHVIRQEAFYIMMDLSLFITPIKTFRHCDVRAWKRALGPRFEHLRKLNLDVNDEHAKNILVSRRYTKTYIDALKLLPELCRVGMTCGYRTQPHFLAACWYWRDQRSAGAYIDPELLLGLDPDDNGAGFGQALVRAGITKAQYKYVRKYRHLDYWDEAY